MIEYTLLVTGLYNKAILTDLTRATQYSIRHLNGVNSINSTHVCTPLGGMANETGMLLYHTYSTCRLIRQTRDPNIIFIVLTIIRTDHSMECIYTCNCVISMCALCCKLSRNALLQSHDVHIHQCILCNG